MGICSVLYLMSVTQRSASHAFMYLKSFEVRIKNSMKNVPFKQQTRKPIKVHCVWSAWNVLWFYKATQLSSTWIESSETIVVSVIYGVHARKIIFTGRSIKLYGDLNFQHASNWSQMLNGIGGFGMPGKLNPEKYPLLLFSYTYNGRCKCYHQAINSLFFINLCTRKPEKGKY